jgi:uncharacterized protein YndB with AHSA1/START domain
MQENNLSVRAATTISATPERVWQVLTDLHRYRRWHPLLELLDGPPVERLAPGITLRLRANQGTPTEREFEVTVTEVAKPLVLAWEGGDPQVFFGRHRFTLTPDTDGTRLVDEEVFSGALAEALLAEHRTALEADYQAGAEALKRTVESRQDEHMAL